MNARGITCFVSLLVVFGVLVFFADVVECLACFPLWVGGHEESRPTKSRTAFREYVRTLSLVLCRTTSVAWLTGAGCSGQGRQHFQYPLVDPMCQSGWLCFFGRAILSSFSPAQADAAEAVATDCASQTMSARSRVARRAKSDVSFLRKSFLLQSKGNFYAGMKHMQAGYPCTSSPIPSKV